MNYRISKINSKNIVNKYLCKNINAWYNVSRFDVYQFTFVQEFKIGSFIAPLRLKVAL